jgi:hypothetical protein
MRRPADEPNDAQRPVYAASVDASLLAWYRWGAALEPNNRAWAEKLKQMEAEGEGDE